MVIWVIYNSFLYDSVSLKREILLASEDAKSLGANSLVAWGHNFQEGKDTERHTHTKAARASQSVPVSTWTGCQQKTLITLHVPIQNFLCFFPF